VCQHLTLLVEHDQRCYVAQCEHGTLHLVWRRSTMQFHPSEFRHIAGSLERWSTNADQHIVEDSCVRLFQQPSGGVQLWLCGVGMLLTLLEVHTLIIMLCTAALQLDREQAGEVHAAAQLAAYPSLQVHSCRAWSHN
jgi:hypothetical protein